MSVYLLLPPATAAHPQNSFAVVSAASYGGMAIAAEEIVAAFGSNLASSTVVANTLPLPTQLGGVSVKVRDSLNVERLAPLFFISPTQINFQIPAGTATGATVLTVVNNNANAATANMPVSSVAPGLFTADASGKGLASANVLRIKADGSQVYEQIGRFDTSLSKFVSVPVDLGPNTDQVFLILYGTGFRNRQNANLVKATIGGVNAEVQFAGPQGNFAGLDQMNVRIPRDAGSGELDVVVSFDGQTSNAVRVALKPPVNQDTTYLASLRPENTAMSPSSGYSTLKLSGDEKSAVIRFNYTNLTTPQVSGHIHGPADPGQNAQILFDLDTATKLTDGSMVWTFTNTAGLSAAQIVQALKGGRLYINIHSSKYPSGEIRGHYGLVNGSQTFTPPAAAPPLPTGTPTPRDAARFLTQATFGPKSTAEITALQTKGFNNWLNEQLALPVTTHMSYL
ncbi:MAG: CHRD domain-containing protein, partial [Acidobacteriota bacterium]|nr:CHRD domain-containing protein [Acidobacteriota bacterium]